MIQPWTRVKGGPNLVMLLTLVAMASIISTAHYLNSGLITALSDGQSRLLIARSVVESLHPGPFQFGVIWPWLPQMAMTLFVWNDSLYRTGLAGSVFSMVCYGIACFYLALLVVDVTRCKWCALVGVLAFSSPSLLYQQTLPMSEVPFLAFYLMATYFLRRWAFATHVPKSM